MGLGLFKKKEPEKPVSISQAAGYVNRETEEKEQSEKSYSRRAVGEQKAEAEREKVRKEKPGTGKFKIPSKPYEFYMNEDGTANPYSLFLCVTRVRDDLSSLLDKYRGEEFFGAYQYPGDEAGLEQETTLLLFAMWDRFLQKKMRPKPRTALLNDLCVRYANALPGAESRALFKQTIRYTKLINATFKIAGMYKGCPPGEPLASAYSSIVFDSKKMNQLREDEHISDRFQHYMDDAVNYFTRIYAIYTQL